MEVKCHKCEKAYDCELNKEQGLCNYCKTKLIISMLPGTQIQDESNNTWIRMKDSIDKHLEGYYFNPGTGEYKHASRIVYEDVIYAPAYPENSWECKEVIK